MSASFNLPEYCSLLSEFIRSSDRAVNVAAVPGGGDACHFDRLASQLFGLQFEYNEPYRNFCEGRDASRDKVKHWTDIPAIPVAAFKELELSALPAPQRTRVFYSSGTTDHRPSRHFHSAASLRVYEESLRSWFRPHLLRGLSVKAMIVSLTPGPVEAPYSSLVHMFETVRREFGSTDSLFTGSVSVDNSWCLNYSLILETLERLAAQNRPVVLLGTAFSYVHLLDHMTSLNLRLALPAQSRLLETGGYKGRSRAISRAELHALLETRLGIARNEIISEYGMSELSSQAYDAEAGLRGDRVAGRRVFRFPPWARARIISPETGTEVAIGENGLIRILDLANAYSVMAIETEDLGTRLVDGFVLLGRTRLVEPRGCSLMPAA
jgi:hypothetical protein